MVEKMPVRGYLAIKDVGLFPGRYFGWNGACFGKVAHFQSKSFCWDILTDPSYHKKIVITDRVYVEDMKPLPEENHSFKPHLSAIVFLGPIKKSSFGSRQDDLEEYLQTNRISGFIPDRRDLLYDALRFRSDTTAAIDNNPEDALKGSGRIPSYLSDDVKSISTPQEYLWDLVPGNISEEIFNVVVWDFGTSYKLLRAFKEHGCRIRVVPSDTSPEDIVALHPDGIILSGSPLSPAGAKRIIHNVERIIGIRPLLGLGGGAVTLAQALGMEITNLESPHYGSAIPVENLQTGRISATYQSHSLSVDSVSAEASGCEVTHINVCDDSVEGYSNDDYELLGSFYTDTFEESPFYLDKFKRLLHKSTEAA
jgi:carbamoyl-phosphate synthase small subunit